jgi:hypothetical protein
LQRQPHQQKSYWEQEIETHVFPLFAVIECHDLSSCRTGVDPKS